MNLQQIVQALEQNNIQIALNIGVHKYCEIDSNCPLAVELRKVINESDITLEQLIEGFVASQEAPPEAVAYELPEFDAKATIRIAGQVLELDLEDAIKAQLGDVLDGKRRRLDRLEGEITELGRGLYDSYLGLVYRLKETRTLPQLEFSVGDLTRANCLITSSGDVYIFLFPRTYNPQYIVTNGVRYRMDDEDIKALVRDIHIRYYITPERKILDTEVLADNGDTFRHYHRECWGSVQMPEKWDGTLRQLTDFTTQLMGALATINKDSLMTHYPRGMIDIDTLMDRSTKLGEEGIVEEREQPEGGWTTDEPTAHRRWGQRRATRGGLTVEEEMMRRFGRTEVAGDHDTICALCGEPLGLHYGQIAEVCPRDQERVLGEATTEAPLGEIRLTRAEQEERRRVRFDMPNAPQDMELTCNVCGMRAGSHRGGGLICPPDWARGERISD